MNAFANWLFTLLLGWTGGLANRAWNAVVNSAGGISDFFSRYWLLLVLGLIIFGTVLDYGVWLVRWRPYRLWRSWLSRRHREKQLRRAERHLNGSEYDAHTRDTLADWVATPEEQYPVYDLSEAEPAPEQPYRFTQSHQGPYFTPVAQEEVLYEQPYQYVEQPQDAQPYTQPEQPFDPYAVLPQEQFIEEPYAEAPYVEEAHPLPQASGSRRRRTERRQRTVAQRLAGLRERLGGNEEDEGMLDGLPAPINQQDAFHEAVYPSGYTYQPNGQQTNNGQNTQGGPST